MQFYLVFVSILTRSEGQVQTEGNVIVRYNDLPCQGRLEISFVAALFSI
jgi:hypothetical protein